MFLKCSWSQEKYLSLSVVISFKIKNRDLKMNRKRPRRNLPKGLGVYEAMRSWVTIFVCSGLTGLSKVSWKIMYYI